jgi:Family of unknown function (DUF6481)
MKGFKQPDFLERQEVSIKTKKAVLEKFRAKAGAGGRADIQHLPGATRLLETASYPTRALLNLVFVVCVKASGACG